MHIPLYVCFMLLVPIQKKKVQIMNDLSDILEVNMAVHLEKSRLMCSLKLVPLALSFCEPLFTLCYR